MSSRSVLLITGPRLLALVLILLWCFAAVNGAWGQLQMALNNNLVPFPYWVLDAAWLGVLTLCALARGLRLPSQAYVVAWALLAGYIVFAFMRQLVVYEYGLSYQGAGYSQYYNYLLLPFLAWAVPGILDPYKMRLFLLILFLPLAALGVMQFVLSDPILPTYSQDGGFAIFAWRLRGETRAFSLFLHGSGFGHFSSFMLVLMLSTMLSTRKFVLHVVGIPYIVLAIICAYATLTRTVYLEIVAAVLALLVLRGLLRVTWVLRFLPLLNLLLGLVVALWAPAIVDFLGLGGDPLTSLKSWRIRREVWEMHLMNWVGGDVGSILFGLGITQRFSASAVTGEYFLIDNIFVATAIHIGAVGLLVWLICLWQMWRVVLGNALQQQNALHLAIAAVFSTWPLSLMFSNSGSFFWLLFVLMILTLVDMNQREAPESDNHLA